MLTSGSIHESPRRQVYAPILSKVRVAIIQRMARPEEVLVTEDDNGNLIRQHLKDTDAITLYNNMRETLVYLSHLDPIDTVTIMERKLSQQVRRTSRSLFHVLSFTFSLSLTHYNDRLVTAHTGRKRCSQGRMVEQPQPLVLGHRIHQWRAA